MTASGTDIQKQCSKCQRVFKDQRDFMSGTTGWHYCNQGNLWFTCSCGAQLMLTKGRFDWFSPSLLLSPAADAVFKTLGGREELPHLPASLLDLQRVLRDERSTPAQIAAAVKEAPFIAVELLRIANALKIDSSKPMTSLDHAIVYVGRQALGDLARVAALKTFRLRTRSFSADGFWREAQLTAKIAEILAKRYNPVLESDHAYISGFLCNVGKIVAAICQPEIVDRVHALVTTSKQLPHWRQAEKEAGGIDHAQLGEIGSVIWGLPSFVREVAAKHHSIPSMRAGRAPGLVEIVILANQMTHWVLLQPNRIDDDLLQATAKGFQLDDERQQRLADELTVLHRKIDSITDMMDQWLKDAKQAVTR